MKGQVLLQGEIVKKRQKQVGVIKKSSQNHWDRKAETYVKASLGSEDSKLLKSWPEGRVGPQ